MGVSRKNSGDAASEKAVSRKNYSKRQDATASAAPARNVSSKEKALQSEKDHEVALGKFAKPVVELFRDELGLDLSKLQTSELYRLLLNKDTEKEYVLRSSPLVYSPEEKKRVRMEPLEYRARVRVDRFTKKVQDGKGGVRDVSCSASEADRMLVKTIPARMLVDLKADAGGPSAMSREEAAEMRFQLYQYENDPYVSTMDMKQLKGAYGTDKSVPVVYRLESEVEADRKKGALPYVVTAYVTFDDYRSLVEDGKLEARQFQAFKDFSPEFTDEEMMQLGRAGVTRDMLFDGFNHLRKDEKMDLYFGESVAVDGVIETGVGFQNVVGEVSLFDQEDGSVKSEFRSTAASPLSRYEKEKAGLGVDLYAARIQYDTFDGGVVELDLFQRGADGKLLLKDGLLVLNDAAKNLLEFRYAGRLVDGRLHTKYWDKEKKAYVNSVLEGKFNVSVVNDNLSVVQVGVYQRQGQSAKAEEPTIRIHGRKDDDMLVYPDGGNEALRFKTEADRERFIHGGFAIVTNAVFKDYKEKANIPYEAVVVATGQGYAHQFDLENSMKLMDKLRKAQKSEDRQSTKPVRRFSR